MAARNALCLSLLILLLAVVNVHAHFKLDSPAARGTVEDKEIMAPCGGFDTLQNPRNPLPLTGAKVSITALHPDATANFYLILSSNPTANDFSSNSTTRKQIAPTATGIKIGSYSADIDLSKIPEAKEGVQATLQVTFDGGDGLLFQCSDVVLGAATAQTQGSKSAADRMSTARGWIFALVAFAVLLV
ncbi:uncharacterized protein SPPG_00909 [Spizellomyces punctatus DAOM BR117]|uniref:Copper acquisition factor BIM1-like domain-containing protein n=1 Tax=Spizellomyces punctatus (strain DAOM BR117) TaxID=645134 RepID=A0A0L0HRC0_SPIPD|nr:uncharacterized protein SPPG_00909 [Spizellomyces punctatus DAOM BR117]KND03424.1 hypothetical protein SPPG_00909 [Spizellomyces punctatus DAOM BR117]|eukprot:XP_016611463.1 hypothetical protein SPPG_00909 [Spizellomyces punctatus DAOM BR117]